jgi:hypothetical protein
VARCSRRRGSAKGARGRAAVGASRRARTNAIQFSVAHTAGLGAGCSACGRVHQCSLADLLGSERGVREARVVRTSCHANPAPRIWLGEPIPRAQEREGQGEGPTTEAAAWASGAEASASAAAWASAEPATTTCSASASARAAAGASRSSGAPSSAALPQGDPSREGEGRQESRAHGLRLGPQREAPRPGRRPQRARGAGARR